MVINPGGTIASPINLVTVAASVVVANKLLSGDANNDFQITGDGKLQWGAGGASALDTDLYRGAAGRLVTDGNLVIGGAVQIGSPSTNPAGSIYAQAITPNAAYVLQSAGPNLGNLGNIDAHTWQIGYSGNFALGTAVMRWTDGGLLQLAAGTTLQNLNSANEATTATAGANGAVPAQVKGYLIAQDHSGTTIKIPYFAS